MELLQLTSMKNPSSIHVAPQQLTVCHYSFWENSKIVRFYISSAGFIETAGQCELMCTEL